MHLSIPRPVLAVAVAVAVVVAAGVAGCRAGDERLDVGGSTPAETSTSAAAAEPSSTTNASSSTISPVTGVVAATSTRPATAHGTRGTSGGPTTTTPVTGVRAATSTTGLRHPEVVIPQQGDRVVAVFVATGPSPAQPSFVEAKARLTALGYHGYSGGDTDCSQGAKEALPHLHDYSLSLEFAVRDDAEQFAGLYGPILGIATVTVFCVD